MHYSKDPRWIRAKFDSKCQCGNQIRKGDSVFYYPLHHKALCLGCGNKASREFDAAMQDEEFMAGRLA